MSKPTLLAVAIAGAIALGALSPVSAATRHKQAAPSDPSEYDATVMAPVASRPGPFGAPAPSWLAPNACISDEGYGRYSSCDSGTSN
jgi:hypothetical protein